ncbi:MAG: urease accessory protein UreD [Gemmataceae bacterium]|nr:urease accessory protein UreD [Gemmataceae bacterium]
MGPRAVGITRQDLVTPPEFQSLHLADQVAGRIGGADIELVRVGEETRLGACYQQIPMRIMPAFSFDDEPAALLYMITLTTGLMDGDGHRFQVKSRPGTRAVLTGQSASRVHPAPVAYSTQQWDVNVEDDAILVVLPGPTIPYAGSRFYQRARVQLAPTGRLIWGDIWHPGRYDRGELSERFQFNRIVQDFEARRGDRLVYRDRFCWNGPWNPSDVDWYLGGHLATASLFVAGPLPDVMPEPVASVRRSVFRLDTGESCLRWCGSPHAVTADLVAVTMRVAASWTGGPGSRPWLINSSDLAPNHWFSIQPETDDGGTSSAAIASKIPAIPLKT